MDKNMTQNFVADCPSSGSNINLNLNLNLIWEAQSGPDLNLGPHTNEGRSEPRPQSYPHGGLKKPMDDKQPN